MTRPRIDHFDSLPHLEQVLLWCMRAWVIGHSRGVAVQPRIARMFDDLGASDAAGYLDGFMWAVGRGARRSVGIHCVCHPELGADERLLLDTLALQQDHRSLRAVRQMRELLTPSASLAANDCATRLVWALNEAGHLLAAEPDLPGEASMPVDAVAFCPALPGTLH